MRSTFWKENRCLHERESNSDDGNISTEDHYVQKSFIQNIQIRK